MKRCLLPVFLALLGLVAFAAPANAVEILGSPTLNLSGVQKTYSSLFEPSPAGKIIIDIGPCPDNESTADDCFEEEPVPHIFLLMIEQDEGGYVHELGHYADYLLGGGRQAQTTRRAFRALMGVPSYIPWFLSGRVEGSSPGEMWADLYEGCAWQGLETLNSTYVSNGYGFVVSAPRYAQICRFFQTALVGPKFVPAGAQPTGPIPPNSTNSVWCGARPEKVQYCSQEGPKPPPSPPPSATSFIKKPSAKRHHRHKQHFHRSS